MIRQAVESRSERGLSATEKRRLAVLGVPTLGLALSITIVSTHLPKVTQQFTSSTAAIGAVVGGEGIMALAALKAFVVLYLNQGLGIGLVTSSLVISGTGAIILGGAALAGKLGDSLGRIRVMRWGLWVYGIGFAVPLFVTFKPVVAAAVPAIAFGGGAVMALAYALLMPLMPEGGRGALTGFYSVSRGIGITVGPLLAGALISLTAHGVFEATRGFQAMWAVPCAAILASLPLVGRLANESADRKALRDS